VDVVTAVKRAFRPEESGELVIAIRGDSEDSLAGSLIITLGSELLLFLFLPRLVVDDRSAVAWTMMVSAID